MTSTDDVRRLGAVDWFIFVGMLILSASTGVYHALAKGGQQNLSQYLIGDRSMSALPIAMSYFVTYTSATAITGYPADVYLFGMQLGVIYIGYILGTVVVMFLFIPFIRQFNFISIYEYISLRFSLSLRIFAALSNIILTLVFSAVSMVGPTMAFQTVQDVEGWKILLIIGSLCIFYTGLGGLKAVIWTDVFQFVIIMISVTVVLILCSVRAGGVAHVWNYAKDNGKFNIEFSLDPTIRLTFISLLLCGLVSVLNDMSSQVIAQRYLCASTSRTAQKSTLLALPLEAIRILMFASTGIALYAFYNNKLTALIPAVNNTDTLSNIDDVTAPRYEPNYKEPEQIIVYFVSGELGSLPGIQGFFISCLFGGALSTMSSGLNAVSSVILCDIVYPWRSRGSNRSTDELMTLYGDSDTLISQIITVVCGCATTLFAVGLPYMVTFMEITLNVISVFSTPLTAIFLLGMLYPRANSLGVGTGVAVGVLYGMFIVVGALIFQSHGIPPLPVFNVSFYLFTPVNLIITLVVGIIASEIVRLFSPLERRQRVDPQLLAKCVRPRVKVHKKRKKADDSRIRVTLL